VTVMDPCDTWSPGDGADRSSLERLKSHLARRFERDARLLAMPYGNCSGPFHHYMSRRVGPMVSRNPSRSAPRNYSNGAESAPSRDELGGESLEPKNWRIQVFFDGACPLCRREIDMIKRWDRKGEIWFTDIAKPDFDSKEWGIDQKTLMDQMHARLPDGSWVRGVEAFRQIYSLVGFGWIVSLTRCPGVSHIIDRAYQVFAKNRLRWTGRCQPDGSCEIGQR